MEKPSRRPDWIPDRKPFPAAVLLAVQERSGGTCETENCNRPGVEYDHILPVALGGESTLHNCRLLCSVHHAIKTVADVKAIAKADRAGGRSGQYARRQRAKAEGRHNGIKSRGFDRTYRKKMDGTVEKRTND